MMKDINIEKIKNFNIKEQIQIYDKTLPINNSLHNDIIQYIISFNEFEETRLINKKFKSLTEQNETNYYKQLYDSINKHQDNVNNNTYIINHNKSSLHSIEKKLQYKGPYCDLEKIIKICNHGDRILIHNGTYSMYDEFFIEKNIQIIGLTNLSKIECDKTINVNSNNVKLQNIKILSYEQEEAIKIFRECNLEAIDCTFESKSNIVSQTLMWVLSKASLTVTNCQFKKAEEAILISPIAQYVNIQKCHFSNIKVGQLAFGCITILDEDEGIKGMISNEHSLSYVTLKCTKNTFKKINDNYPFVEAWNSNNKTYRIHGKNCYTIENNIIFDEHHIDANKLYQIQCIS